MNEQVPKEKLDGTTHAEGCWTWGPTHYACAIARIEWLDLAQKTNQQTVIRQANEIRRMQKTLTNELTAEAQRIGMYD